MVRRSIQNEPEDLRQKLVDLLQNFEAHLRDGDLRSQVQELVPVNHLLRDIGSSLMTGEQVDSARGRILVYLKKYVGEVIDGDELMVVAGISEYARRVRELRVEHGWPILTGVTISEMRKNAQAENDDEINELPPMRTDQYILSGLEQDLETAYRWNIANEIRKDKKLGVRDKILKHFRENVGKAIFGEELRYVANNRTEWARRTRELRTEHGWPITTKSNGRPDLPIGAYVLEKDRQSPPHDRKINDSVRRSVMLRDNHKCRNCNWHFEQWNPYDPRHLEIHHVLHHAKGGSNEENNLITYCNICHDVVHKKETIGEV